LPVHQTHTDAQSIADLWHGIGEYPYSFYFILDQIKAKYSVFERYELKQLIFQKI